MKNINYTSTDDFYDWIDLKEIFNWIEKENQDYHNWDEKYKQDYWNRYVLTIWWYNERWTSLPIDVKKLRKRDKNFDRFLPWIINLLEEEWFTWDIEDIFILDEKAKKALKISNETINTPNIVENTIEDKKQEEIESMWFEELAERIWDLYYDALSFFLDELADNVKNWEIKKLLKQASNDIGQAWEICKIPTQKFLEEIEKSWKQIKYKHTNEVKWLSVDKKELAKIIWNLEENKLKEFLEKLSEKIKKDWEADRDRNPPRIKLANNLFNCAEKLKQASII